MLGNLQILISGLLKYGHLSNISCNKACDICKSKCMVIKLIPLVYVHIVNNYDKNRYLVIKSRAAVHEGLEYVSVIIEKG